MSLVYNSNDLIYSSSVPLVTAGLAYAAGNVVGGLLQFPCGVANTMVFQEVIVNFKSVQPAGISLILFSGLPINSTFTDKTAPSINALDTGLCLGYVPISTVSSALGVHTNMTTTFIGAMLKAIPAASNSLYGLLITTGTPTYTTTSDLVNVCIGVQKG